MKNVEEVNKLFNQEFNKWDIMDLCTNLGLKSNIHLIHDLTRESQGRRNKKRLLHPTKKRRKGQVYYYDKKSVSKVVRYLFAIDLGFDPTRMRQEIFEESTVL
jgi:hypothetical protein